MRDITPTQPKRHPVRTVLKVLGGLLAVVLVAVALLAAVLTVTEYHPAQTETLLPEGNASKTLAAGDTVSILSWNIGYAALGDNADFFMDGGTHVRTSSKDRVEQNLDAILAQTRAHNPDIALFQEVDANSDRSFNINQVELLETSLDNSQRFFAPNYQVLFVPLGVPPYGKIESGVTTLSTYAVDRASRESLPAAYTWPASAVQLKRCNLVVRIPVEGTRKQLVVFNVHPDAYTDEEHHAAQVDAIREALEAEAAAGNYVIAGGDWNHTFSTVDGSAYPLLDESNWRAGVIEAGDFTAGWQFVMDSAVPTCRLLDHPLATEDGDRYEEIVQYYLLDGFIVSSNIEVQRVETQDLGFVASDHNPVLLQVKLKEE